MQTTKESSSGFKVKQSIIVRTRFAGFHHWPEAPEEVRFLRCLHRHVFHVAAHFGVDHSNRALEFFITQIALTECIHSVVIPMLQADPSKSCEMIAELIMDGMYTGGYNTIFKVVVSEDGENDGVVERV